MSPEKGAEDIFECRRCGDCCKGFGGTVVDEADIRQIAAYLGIPPRTFWSRYCVPSGSRSVLAQGPDGYCAFWDQLCAIHPVKPRMCRAWPYIDSVLADVANWRVMAGVCPGIRTDISDEHIVACVKAKRQTAR